MSEPAAAGIRVTEYWDGRQHISVYGWDLVRAQDIAWLWAMVAQAAGLAYVEQALVDYAKRPVWDTCLWYEIERALRA